MNTRKTIKAIFFDIGGVLVRVDSSAAIKKLSSRLKVDETHIRDAMSRDLMVKYEKGHLDSNQFYENLLINCASSEKMELSEFKMYWQDVLFPKERMIAFLDRAIEHLPTWLLSNTNDFHYEILVEKFPFMKKVNGGTYSFMVASMKPESLIYEQAIRKCGELPQHILFIDDLEENVNAARSLGLNTILYTNFNAFQAELRGSYPELGHLL
ncbi:MAG: HAD family phosphatase [Candidatus Marinimicrobia bacterium]|nr:HAD family phosphatase [Candidatus Neomarinimicrobiota bacterium]MCF7904010.1 HAD family phosphatase [Candidatus Neomarinimicrobiota bacterium]